MKANLLFTLLLVMLFCLQGAQSQCCCSTTGLYSIRDFATFNDAKQYVTDLLNQYHNSSTNFLSMLGKMSKDKLSVVINQLRKLLKFTKGIPKYNQTLYGKDFLKYCSSYSSSNSLTSQNPETPFGYKTYDRPYFFVPFYKDLINDDPNLYQDVPDQSFVQDFETIVLLSNPNTIYNPNYNSENNMQGNFVMLNDSGYYYLNKTVVQDRVDSYLCLTGYQAWFKNKMDYLIQNSGNSLQLFYYLNNHLIPNLFPIDQMIFARWSAIWIKATFDDGTLESKICEEGHTETCNRAC